MMALPLANILHHKLRSALGALGVAIGVCMLVALSGLSRGTLEEVGDRWNAVQADLIVYSSHWGDNITTSSGAGLNDADTEKVSELRLGGAPAVRYAVPIFLNLVKIEGADHNVVGVSAEHLPRLMRGRGVLPGGRAFDPRGEFSAWIRQRLSAVGQEAVDLKEQDLAEHGGLEVVVDARLARANHYSVGSTLYMMGHHFTVVGIAPEGTMARVMLPLETAEYLGNGRLGYYSLLFVKLGDGVQPAPALEAVRSCKGLAAVPVSQYRAKLEERFGVMYTYIDIVNGVTLTVSFLFILVTLYTNVIQHQREIAILKSMGAARALVLRQVLWESMILTVAGTLAGIAASFGVAAGVEHFRPLMTVAIGWHWIAIAVAAALGGGALAALYPAWWAMRLDVVEALSLE